MEVSHARSVKAKVVENVTICFQKSQIAIHLELLFALPAYSQFDDFSCKKLIQKGGLDVVLHHFNVLGKHFTIWTNPRGFSQIRLLTEQSVLVVEGFVVDDILELQSSRAQQDLQCLSDTELNQRHYLYLPVPSLILQL